MAALVTGAAWSHSPLVQVLLLLSAALPWAWLVRRWRRGALRAGRLAFVVVAAAHLSVALAPPSLSDDVYRYAWEGRVAQARGAPAPYLHAPDDDALAPLRTAWSPSINHPSLTSIYFPTAQTFFRLVSRGPDPVRAVKVGLAGANVLAVLLLALWLRRRGEPAAGALVYGASPLAIVETGLAGHVDALGLLLVVAGLALFDLGLGRLVRGRRSHAERSRAFGDLASGAAFGLAVMVKPPALLPLGLVLLHPDARGRRRPLVAGAAAAALAVLVPFLPAGTGLLRTFGTFASSWRGNDPVHQLVLTGYDGLWRASGLDTAGPDGGRLYAHVQLVRGGLVFSGRESVPLVRWGEVAEGYPAPPDLLLDVGIWPETLARGTVGLLILALLLLLVRAARRRPQALPPARVVLLGTAGALLLSPTSFPWYWLWAGALLPVAFEPALAVLLATLPLFYLTNLPAVGLVGGGPGWLMAATYLPALLVLAVTGWRTRGPAPGPAAGPA